MSVAEETSNFQTKKVLTLTKKVQHHYIRFVCFLFLLLGSLSGIAQENEPKPAPSSNVNTAVREEIQRYIGYETLPARYISLPYDVTMNTNVQGPIVDITYYFLMFIPLFFLLGFWKRPVAGTIFMLTMVVFLCISVANSNVIDSRSVKILETTEDIRQFAQTTSFGDAPIDWAVAQTHLLMRSMYIPFDGLFSSVSGSADRFTYPLLMVLFVLGFLGLYDRIRHLPRTQQAIISFTYLFVFLWLLLTAGIVWYGYLMILLGIVFMMFSFGNKTEREPLQKIPYYGMFGFLGIGLVLLVGLRITNYQPTLTKEANRQMMFDPALLKYQVGSSTFRQTLNEFYPNITDVIDKINQDEKALVYRVGTVFSYFIKKNNERVLLDNQLGVFYNIAKKYQTRGKITEVLKASNYKYILVDLNTPQIDQTPEKTLTQKFQMLMGLVHQNPSITLLATNREVMTADKQIIQKVVPNSEAGEQIYRRGSYAIYEIK